MRRAITPLLLAAVVLTGCNSAGDRGAAPDTTIASSTSATTADTEPSTSPDSTAVPVPPETTTVTSVDPDRPWELFTPSGYQDGTPTPLVVMLHAFTASGAIEEAYLGIQAEAEQRGFLYVHPDGATNIVGQRYWNATDACCGLRSEVDDVAYITSIIDAVSAERSVDPRRVFLIGHSNGGFMSYRMACDLSPRIAAMASVAGATFDDPSKCAPSSPVSVLQVHGTADETIAYAGGVTPVINGTYPGAERTTELWAGYNGCTSPPAATGTTLDVEANLPGAETEVRRAAGCPAGVDVELWVLQGGRHTPGIIFPDGSRPLTSAMIDFLLAHPKP